MRDEEIIDCICDFFNVSTEDIFSKKRNKKFIEVRMFIYFFLNKECKYTYSKIARIFSYDHGTIINGVKNLENICSYDISYKECVNEIFLALRAKKFYLNVLDVNFYRNFVKKIILEDPLNFYKLNISLKEKNIIYKDLKLNPQELERLKQYEWKKM